MNANANDIIEALKRQIAEQAVQIAAWQAAYADLQRQQEATDEAEGGKE